MRAHNLTGAARGPAGTRNRRKSAPTRGGWAFWGFRCAWGVPGGYIKSQKHLKATLTARNKHKRAKIVRNPSFRARERRKSKIWHANGPFAAGNRLQTLILGDLRDTHVSELLAPPDACYLYYKAPKTAVRCGASCPRRCKIGTENVRNRSNSNFRGPHVDGIMPWDM
jgi:hypothetical protein